ncbi:SIS domain-containing protein [bacterium]|jgi:D-sedoheptulose 7-phosphate isomerase|nr:SIS domain-containing protein [bacterium]
MAIDPATHLDDLAATAARAATVLRPQIAEAARRTVDTLRNGGTIFFCGNGGSAADAQHMAAEYVVRYRKNRQALRSIALTTDTSVLTAHANDFGYEAVFSRQLEALGRAGDLLMIHTTSGTSLNCIHVVRTAKSMGITTICLTARDGGDMQTLADLCIIVPTDRTDRAQEIHLNIQHAICDVVDEEIGV